MQMSTNKKEINIDDLDIIKHIGKGSFSNVYLCKNNLNSTVFFTKNNMMVNLHHQENEPEFFIVKEININNLVKKYIKTSVCDVTIKNTKKNSQTDISIDITPYNKKRQQITTRASEYEYYFKRLQELIESEIEVLNIIDHENIITFYDWYKNGNVYYLLMEYSNKGDVYDFLKNNKALSRNIYNGVAGNHLNQFIIQIIDGLHYLHNKNIIHRDIKLHNVLLSEKNNKNIYKLTDFGFACYDVSNMNNSDIDLDDLLCKKYFKLCGTPFYMAPEIILNMKKMENITQYTKGTQDTNESDNDNDKKYKFYNKAIDIWSLGICIYEIVFNDLPYTNISNIKDLEKFFLNDFAQSKIDKKINDTKVINTDIKSILLSTLCINPLERKDINYLKKYVDEHINISNANYQFSEDIEEMKYLEEIIKNEDNLNCFQNNYITNEVLKNHIIKTPENINVITNDSWENVNTSDSLLKHLNIEKGFVDWLLKKF